MQSEKEIQVIKAAYNVFIRYGFARTTMSDLAKEAGLSRPALYLVYPGKTEVFQAVLSWAIHSMLETLAATVQADWPLQRKLLQVLEVCVASLYDRVRANPDAQDLLSLDSQIPGIQQAYSQMQTYVADLLQEAVEASTLGVTAAEVARTLMAATKGFKIVATDGQDLRRLMALQVAMVCAALGQADRGEIEVRDDHAPLDDAAAGAFAGR